MSNVGSLLALLAYPTLVEPLFPVSRQAALWSAAYAAFVIACAWLALGVARAGSYASPTPNTGNARARGPLPFRRRCRPLAGPVRLRVGPADRPHEPHHDGRSCGAVLMGPPVVALPPHLRVRLRWSLPTLPVGVTAGTQPRGYGDPLELGLRPPLRSAVHRQRRRALHSLHGVPRRAGPVGARSAPPHDFLLDNRRGRSPGRASGGVAGAGCVLRFLGAAPIPALRAMPCWSWSFTGIEGLFSKPSAGP